MILSLTGGMRMSYKIGMYLRLSNDDEKEDNKFESDSISAQRDIIKSYITEHTDLIGSEIKEFCDDGYSGVDFKRAGVQKLFEEIKNGRINCVIVKDLSRFGRNLIEVGDYLEQIFPILNVRFIAINDNYDSNNNIGVAGTEVAFKNLMNENYSKDLSDKIKSVVRSQQDKGYFVGGWAPYGYKNVNKTFVVDNKAAKVVRRIFEMSDSGMKYTEIARTLNKEGVYTKKEYRYGRKLGCIWSAREVSTVLHNKAYIGTLISRKTNNYTPNKAKNNDESEYLIFENHHEPIVSKKLFESVSKKFYTRKITSERKVVVKEFYRKVICGGCGKALAGRILKNNVRNFICPNKITSVCVNQKISISALKEIILNALNVYINLMVENVDRYKSKIKSNKEVSKDIIKSLESEIAKLEQKKLILYTEYKDGILSKEEYLDKREYISDKTENLSKKKETTQKDCVISENCIEADNLIREYKSKKLTDEMLIEKYLKKVTIYSDDKIEIEWNFEDIFSLK